MNSFEELYNSTLKICPIKEGYSWNESSTVGRNSEEVNEEKQGGFIDLNIPVSAQPKQNYTDYNKIDPVAIYRNKMSLKNVPYDIDKVKILYNRETPGSQTFSSWINNANKKASIDGKYYKNFVRWMDSTLRRSLWNEKCCTGIQRVSLPELNGIHLKNVYKLIDFDYKIVWEYCVLDEESKYNVIVNARRTKGDNIKTNITEDIKKYHNKRVNQPYYYQYTDAEFYNNKYFEDIFLHPEQYEIVDRESVSYANCQPITISRLFQENDPRLPQLKEGSKRAYETYIQQQQQNQQGVQGDSWNESSTVGRQEEELKKSITEDET